MSLTPSIDSARFKGNNYLKNPCTAALSDNSKFIH